MTPELNTIPQIKDFCDEAVRNAKHRRTVLLSHDWKLTETILSENFKDPRSIYMYQCPLCKTKMGTKGQSIGMMKPFEAYDLTCEELRKLRGE